jgi:hypothetical protein
MIQHIVWWALLLGLVLGAVGIFGMKPMMTPVMKYPTPETADKLLYKDKNGICYKYITKELNCDANESRLKSFPLS